MPSSRPGPSRWRYHSAVLLGKGWFALARGQRCCCILLISVVEAPYTSNVLWYWDQAAPLTGQAPEGLAGSGGYNDGDAASVAATALQTGRATPQGRLRRCAPHTGQGAAGPQASSGAGSRPVAAVSQAPVVCGRPGWIRWL